MVRINKKQRRKMRQRARDMAADAQRLALSKPQLAATEAYIAEMDAIRASPQKSKRLGQLRTQKFEAQRGICPECGNPLTKSLTSLLRKNPNRNYTTANTELLHYYCVVARRQMAGAEPVGNLNAALEKSRQWLQTMKQRAADERERQLANPHNSPRRASKLSAFWFKGDEKKHR
jgi:hypothetical protein